MKLKTARAEAGIWEVETEVLEEADRAVGLQRSVLKSIAFLRMGDRFRTSTK
jgi:hypothetical protein